MNSHYRVGIVGFGIAGGALAIMLARAGHTVTLLERAPEVGPVGAGFLLQPTGQSVLRRLGLLDAVIGPSEPIHAIHAFKANGRTLVHLQHKHVLPGKHAYGVHRGLLFETLQRAVEKERVTIEVGQTITGWQVDGGHVDGQRVDGQAVYALTDQGHRHGPFDFLVAADGSRSALRSLLNPKLAAREYDFGAAWAVGRGAQVKGYLHQITQGTRQLLGLLPIGSDRIALFWLLPQAQLAAFRGGSFDRWRAEVVRLSPLAAETMDDIGSFEAVTMTAYRDVSPPIIFNSHLVCIGDAAHSSSPHLGQGANLALLDAECLAASLEFAPHPAAAFRQYWQTRQSQIRYYSTLSRWLTPFFQSNYAILGLGRDLALPIMSAIPPIRNQMELAMTGVKTGWLSSAAKDYR